MSNVKRTHYFLLIALFSLMARAAVDFLSPGLAPADIQPPPAALQVIDLRTPAEFRVAHIPGAINIPMPELERRLDKIRRDTDVLIYCINGSRTRQAEPVLYAHGFENIYHLEGAFYAWIKGKYPVEKGGIKQSDW